MPAVTVARGKFQRISTYRESALGVGDAGVSDANVKHQVAIRDTSFALSQEMEEDTSQTTERGTTIAPWAGAKSCALAFKTPLHKRSFLAVGDYFESALGGVESLTALSGVASITASSFTFSGGACSRWVAVTYASGRVVFRPVMRVVPGSPSTAHFAFQLPTASGVSTVVNAKDFGGGGACYFEAPSSSYLSFTAELDRAGETGQLKSFLTGLVPSSLRLSVEGRQRKAIDLAFQGLDWTDPPVTLTKIGDPERPTSQAAAWSGEVYLLTDYDSPGAAPAPVSVVGATVNLAPSWEASEGTQSRTGAAESGIKSHPVTEWVRAMSLADPILELTLQVPQISLYGATPGAEGTKFHIAWIDYLGSPGSSGYAGDAVCHYAPLAYLASRPEEVAVGGRMGQRLRFHLRDERALGNSAGQMSDSQKTKWTTAFFRA